MKLITVLIFACIGVMLYAVLFDRKSASPMPASVVPGRSAYGAPTAASAWSSSAPMPTAAYPSSSGESSSPGVISSVWTFIKHALPMGGHRTSWQIDELRIARGNVVDHLDTGFLIDCSRWIVQGRSLVYAGDGVGMNALYANIVDTDELFSFGHLMTVDHGELRQSVYDRSLWNTGSYLNGRSCWKVTRARQVRKASRSWSPRTAPESGTGTASPPTPPHSRWGATAPGDRR